MGQPRSANFLFFDSLIPGKILVLLLVHCVAFWPLALVASLPPSHPLIFSVEREGGKGVSGRKALAPPPAPVISMTRRDARERKREEKK